MEDKFLMMEDDFAQCQNENEKFDARVAYLEEELEATNSKVNNLPVFFRNPI